MTSHELRLNYGVEHARMSTEHHSTGGPAETEASPHSTTVGGSKPLHRFIRREPKTVGVIVLILGTSFFIVSMALHDNIFHENVSSVQPGFVLGTLFIISGIMFILAEHNPTKKTVTISLALSIVTTLAGCWATLYMLVHLDIVPRYREYFEINASVNEDAYWYLTSEVVGHCLNVVFAFHTLVALVIFIVMSCLARAALHSTKSQAIIFMTTAATETPVE